MRKSVTTIFAAAVVMALATPALAGGFYVLLGSPEASSEARAQNAFATIKLAGCHEPEKAGVNATAIGLVDGKRQTIPLKLVPLSEPGMYAVTRQWPTEGRWVLQFVATDQDRVTSSLVGAGPTGIERATIKTRPGQPASDDIASLLKSGTAVSAVGK